MRVFAGMLLFTAGLVGACSSSARTIHETPDYTLSLTGNFQYDFASIDPDTSAGLDNFAWRRKRLGMVLAYGKQLELSAEYDFEAREFTDALIKYKGLGPGQLQVGQFKQPVALEELTSDKRTLFIEAPPSNVFAVSRRLGLGYLWNPGRFGLHGTLFGRNLNGVESTNGGAVRGWWTPIQQEDSVLHLGLAASREAVIASSFSFSARPETRFGALRAARTPSFADADDLWRLGLEVLAVHGPWTAQGEWLGSRIERDQADFNGSGAYLQVGYSFGAQRSYKGGTLQAVSAGRSFELGARVANIDLNDGAVRGGSAHSRGLVATWYLEPETRVMANLLHIERSASTAANAEDFEVFEVRLQYVF